MMAHVLDFLHVETFRYTIPGHGTLIWNVSAAKDAIAAGQVLTRVPIAREQMAGIVAKNEYEEARVAMVDPSRPGIGAPFLWEGRVEYLLIDGTHRCVKAYRMGVPFEVDLLTDEAAKACLIVWPLGLMAWDAR